MKINHKKIKIIIGTTIAIMLIAIGYYVYAKENTFTIEQEELKVSQGSTEESIEEKTKEETSKELKKEIEEKIIIHISGAVNKEGILELPENSRVADAIESAGGTKENACINEINLAEFLEDGIKIHIPTKEELELFGTVPKSLETENSSASANNQSIESSTSTYRKTENTKVNINKATQTEFESLPGIGPSTALKIIQYRNENGKFKAIDNIKEVSGIGENKYNKIKELINV